MSQRNLTIKPEGGFQICDHCGTAGLALVVFTNFQDPDQNMGLCRWCIGTAQSRHGEEANRRNPGAKP